MAASSVQQPWSFDVSSLMILVSEGEEERYRLSQRSLLECLVTAPVVGLQNYIRSYDFLLDAAKLEYFSPSGVKAAPLRHMCLSNAISQGKLLEDSRYSIYRIPDSLGGRKRMNRHAAGPAVRKFQILFAMWALFTWTIFAGVMAFTIRSPDTTWIGITNCAAFTAWSIFLRLVEMVNIRLAGVNEDKIALPAEPDAVYILGRNNSAFVLEGTRRDIKRWTVRGLVYRTSSLGVPARGWQACTRLGSLAILLFIFSSIPNGSTMDQVAFIVVNGLAQVNVLVGQWFNNARCLAELELHETETPETRTEVYGLLVRRFAALDARNGWIDASGLLPHTDVWKEWKPEVLRDNKRGANEIYREIASRKSGTSSNPHAPPAMP